MTEKTIWTFNELAREYGKDPTYVARMVRLHGLAVTSAMQDKHVCKALSSAEKAKLEKKNPNLTLDFVGKGERELNDIAEERGQLVDGLLKFLKAHDFEIEKRLHEDGGRPVNVLSAKEYARLMKSFPKRVVIE